MLFYLLHLLLGYYTVSATGNFPERFLNLCNKNELVLWNLRLTKEALTFRTGLRSMKKMRELAEKTGIQLENVEMHGLPAFFCVYRKRYALIWGVLLFFGLMWYLSSFIWAVEMVPIEGVDSQAIITKLEELGLSEGVKKSSLDLDDLYQEMLLDVPEISWIAVNIKGTRAEVEVRRRVPKPEIASEDPCNVVAREDGQIVYMEVYEGKTMVETRAAVQKGELLVSGVLDSKTQGMRLVPARAKIMAKTYRTLTADCPLLMEKERYTGETTERHYLKILGFRLNFYLNGRTEYQEYDTVITRQQFQIGDLYLPIFWVTESDRELERFQVQLTEEQAQKVCTDRVEELKKELEGIEITDEQPQFSLENGVVTLRDELECEEDIAETEKILVDSFGNIIQ